MHKMKQWIKNEIAEYRVLLKCIPATAFAMFVVALVAMNLLANKLVINESWIAIDAGIVVSWIAFLIMDMMVKRFGPKATTKITLTAIFMNLVVVAIFNIGAILPGTWGQGDTVAINATIAGSAHILFASTVAFIVSATTNNFLNWGIKRRFHKNPHGFSAYAVSSYASTLVAQFIDNFVFALLFTFAKGWITLPAMFTFALIGAGVELFCQIVFSPIGYKIAEKWRVQGIGNEYLEMVKMHKEAK